MKPFARIIPWIRHQIALNAEQKIAYEAIPILREERLEDEISQIEPVVIERLIIEKQPLGQNKSGEIVMNHAHPNLIEDMRAEHFEEMEERWAEQTSNKRKIDWKLVPAVYAVAALAHTLITMISMPKANIEQIEQRVVQEQEAVIEQKEVASASERLESAVEGYLNASTVDEKMQWVRHPMRIKPLMDLHYEKNSMEERKFSSIQKMKAVSAWSKSYILISAELTSGEQQFLAVEHTPEDTYKIDWETDVCYQPISWKIFSNVKSSIAMDMRVMVKPDAHYTMNFSEEDDYVCFRMVTRDNQKPIYGYVKKSSPVWHDLRIFFTAKKQTSLDGEPLILRLRVPEHGIAKNGVIIERFLSDRWLYLDSPAGSNPNRSMADSK